jgi:hypothetical protein
MTFPQVLTAARRVGLSIEVDLMKQSDVYRQNAENCMQMAEAAQGEPAYNRFKRTAAAWLALAEEQDWLDGERSPIDPAKKPKGK